MNLRIPKELFSGVIIKEFVDFAFIVLFTNCSNINWSFLYIDTW